MIGRSPDNNRRKKCLERLKDSGYRGTVRITAYYAVDVYDITDDGVTFCGRRQYRAKDWLPANFGPVYRAYVTAPDKP